MKFYSGIIGVAVTLLLATSCKKTDTPGKPIEPLPIGDARSVLLKDIISEKLPSPYFHFSYDNARYVTEIGYADGMLQYKLAYENHRVKTMTNKANGNILNYVYTNGKVSAIKKISAVNGKALRQYEFAYYTNGSLKEIRWLTFKDGGVDSVMERKVVLIYNADGNLAEFDELRNNGHNEMLWSRTVEFQYYDQGINVDDIYMFKDFFEDVLFLPQVKLQKNNPAFSRVTGQKNDYQINFTYQYNNKQLPIKKNIDILQTRGTGAGQHDVFSEEFSYY